MRPLISRQPTKLFTRKTYLLILAASLVGAVWPLVREYHRIHTLKTSSIVISLITFAMALAIAATMAWWANRPE